MQRNQTSYSQNSDVESIAREVLLKINNIGNKLRNNFQRNNYTSKRRNIRGYTRSSCNRNYGNNTSDNVFKDNDDEPSEINIYFLEEGTERSSPT